ncbi:uncharacterized protein F5147DRAFT_658722 [Suillus discolor]|uniref:DUF6532 domain-containing protein n=1 Tax=Suillus discolor TaxID=1912936 RepID=A0A9P7JM21_9AGAM|nr:uncharacterized protein F5147DRAFT_658722 [Suillus discolor]KAG2088384.1 hypothetical protein F5147DRAFT_658722 [Suillus discolor]
MDFNRYVGVTDRNFEFKLENLVYDKNNSKHQHIVDSAKDALIRNAVNENCLTNTSTRQQLVLQELRAAAISEYKNDEVFAKNWAGVNSVTLYMDLSAPYENIMQTQKRIARTLVQRGYHLRPPARAATIEPEHQASKINELIDDMIVFPPRYVFGENEVTHELHFLENEVVWDVLLNTVVELDLYPYIVDLNKMFCAAAAAVKCALMELRMGKFQEIDFTFQGFEQIYKELMKHIDDTSDRTKDCVNKALRDTEFMRSHSAFADFLLNQILATLCSLHHQASFVQSTLSRGSRRLRSKRPRATVNNVEIPAWQNSPEWRELPRTAHEDVSRDAPSQDERRATVESSTRISFSISPMSSVESLPKPSRSEWRKPPRTAHEDVSRAAPSQDERRTTVESSTRISFSISPMSSVESLPKPSRSEWRKPPRTAHEDVSRAAPS